MTLREVVFRILFFLFFLYIFGCSRPAGETVEPVKVETQEPVSFNNVFSEIFEKYVDEEGMVDYKQLKRERRKVRQVLLKCRRLKRAEYDGWPEDEKKAFWLNVYNVKLLEIISDNYPIEPLRLFMIFWPPDSIRHIDKRLEGIDKQKFIVMEEEFTLREIEKRFFRGEFAEPILFIGLARATVAGPPFRNEAYFGHKLYEQLDEQVRKFLLNPEAFRIDRDKKIVYLSAIFRPRWFGNEFVSKYNTNKKFKDMDSVSRSVLNFASGYISKSDLDFIELESYSVSYINYDWRLNDRRFHR
jgi:hypothetical protein